MIKRLEELNDSSRVWIYQSDRKLTTEDKAIIQKHLVIFLDQWTAHSATLHCHGAVYHDLFLTLFVDESSSAGASGCSIDSSVRFVQQLGELIGVNFFDRMNYAYKGKEGQVKSIRHTELNQAYADGNITDETIMYDNLVKTKKEFEDRWQVQLKSSWHYRFV